MPDQHFLFKEKINRPDEHSTKLKTQQNQAEKKAPQFLWLQGLGEQPHL